MIFAQSHTSVAPLAGSVDRNRLTVSPGNTSSVAPLAGSVDRNVLVSKILVQVLVAPLAGSVDRNRTPEHNKAVGGGRSPRGERG